MKWNERGSARSIFICKMDGINGWNGDDMNG